MTQSIMSQAVMQLEPLSCPSCIKKIESALQRMDGVQEAKVLFNSSKTKVTFDQTKVNADQLQQTVEALGYDVRSVKTP